MSALKKRADNLPEKMTAHTVRNLAICDQCGGFGYGPQMIFSTTHTHCAAATMTAKELRALPAKERGKFRLMDLECVTNAKREAILR